MGETKIEADRIEEDYKDLKPFRELLKFWDPEGGEYMACKCGFIMFGEDSIDSSTICDVVTCGKCGAQYEVFGIMIGYREYKEV